jgi:hypothetical protein
MADRVRFIQPVSVALQKLGCKKVGTLDEYNSLWVTDSGVMITIPDFGTEDKCPEEWWFDIQADIARLKK